MDEKNVWGAISEIRARLARTDEERDRLTSRVVQLEARTYMMEKKSVQQDLPIKPPVDHATIDCLIVTLKLTDDGLIRGRPNTILQVTGSEAAVKRWEMFEGRSGRKGHKRSFVWDFLGAPVMHGCPADSVGTWQLEIDMRKSETHTQLDVMVFDETTAKWTKVGD